MNEEFYIPQPYTLRRSPRAKYLQLRVSPAGIEVIVPDKKYLSQTYIRQFLMQKQAWIKKIQQRFQLLAPQLESQVLPSVINLAAIEQVWQINYCKTTEQRVSCITNAAQQLTLAGNIEQHSLCYAALRQWVKHLAKQQLEPHLARLAVKTGLAYRQVKIRLNSTRWGSCSSKRHISLCCKLLFLPPALVEHVLLHELCHTKIMNHSTAFWRLLTKFDHQAMHHAKLLRKAGNNVPGWMTKG